MADADTPADDLVDALFTRKKRRGTKKQAKKRQRRHFEDDESDTEAVVVPRTDTETKAKKKKSISGWQRVEYKADASVKSDKATGERRDTGGADKAVKKKSTSSYGPLGAPTNLRVTVRMDYQPDVCKDYKETGYCGFGDSCKFLHDRTDYAAGWQLERDWVARTKARNERLMRGEDPDAPEKKDDGDIDGEGLPFACYICRGNFKSPVETLCSHYFCEDCALKRMSKDSTCAVCKTQLRGTLNTAHRLVAKLARESSE